MVRVHICNAPNIFQFIVIDRLDTPPSYYRPYLRSVIGCPIVHIIIGAPFNVEETMGNEIFLTLAWQDFPSPPQAIHSEDLTGILVPRERTY